MVKLLFGKAGSGKSYVGRLCQKKFGFHFHDGDSDLPEEMKEAIRNLRVVSEEMRDFYANIIIEKILDLQTSHENLCVGQALFKNRHRKLIQESVPGIELVWVDAPVEAIESRLKNRVGHIASKYYAELINRGFEVPNLSHLKIENGFDSEHLDAQLLGIFSGLPSKLNGTFGSLMKASQSE